MRALLAFRLALVACLVLFAAACGDTSGCLPAVTGMTPCPAGTFIDASTTDPLCFSGGVPLCRGSNDAICYVCTGSDFTDNCTLTSPQQTEECVHSCGKC